MNGPDSPYNSNPIETARLMELRVQPNSVVSAGKKTPGATRAPAEMRIAAAIAAMTYQWRDMRMCASLYTDGKNYVCGMGAVKMLWMTCANNARRVSSLALASGAKPMMFSV